MGRPYCAPVGTPARPRHPFLDWPGPVAFAHRGGAAEAPENTLPAFKGAVDLGFRFLETDARVTADGVVVAFHDDDLSRTCNRPGFIHELPWSEVATARVDGREPIPRLTDVLDAFPEVRINVDCKSDDVVRPAVRPARGDTGQPRSRVRRFVRRRPAA